MRKRILLVDDEQDIAAVSSVRLEKSGYEVLTAATGKEALDLVKNAGIDLILLDLLLPRGLQGDEICKKLKCDNRFKTIPVILFTASCSDIQKVTKDVCADDYIMKPFEPEELLSKVKKFIG